MMKDSWKAPKKPAKALPTINKFTDWEVASTSIGFVTELDDELSVKKSAADQMKAWLSQPDGPFWSYWVEYSSWDSLTPRQKSRTWRYPQVEAVKDQADITASAPRRVLKAPQMIARLVVRFFNAVTSGDTYTFQADGEDEGFRHAFMICQFVKDQALTEAFLDVGEGMERRKRGSTATSGEVEVEVSLCPLSRSDECTEYSY